MSTEQLIFLVADDTEALRETLKVALKKWYPTSRTDLVDRL
jgi:hypothetical protein